MLQWQGLGTGSLMSDGRQGRCERVRAAGDNFGSFTALELLLGSDTFWQLLLTAAWLGRHSLACWLLVPCCCYGALRLYRSTRVVSGP